MVKFILILWLTSGPQFFGVADSKQRCYEVGEYAYKEYGVMFICRPLGENRIFTLEDIEKTWLQRINDRLDNTKSDSIIVLLKKDIEDNMYED